MRRKRRTRRITRKTKQDVFYAPSVLVCPSERQKPSNPILQKGLGMPCLVGAEKAVKSYLYIESSATVGTGDGPRSWGLQQRNS